MNGRKTAKDEQRLRQENAKCNLAPSTLKPQGGPRGQTLHAHPGGQKREQEKKRKGADLKGGGEIARGNAECNPTGVLR